MKQILMIIALIAISICKSAAQDSLYDGGSTFVCGFARIEKGNNHFYIDSLNNIAFDDILNATDFSTSSFNGINEDTSLYILPERFVLVRKNGKSGVLTTQGKWILEAKYDTIDTHWQYGWTVTLNGKKSMFTPSGFLLPFRFEDLDNLDDNYFDVKQNGKWGIYSKKDDRMVVPFEYEEFDYCYGCEQKGDYVFAKKNDKWGVVNFNNEVLVPFEYDHEHLNMRSDEWVECLYKDGKQLSINLKTKVVTPYEDTDDDEGDSDMAAGFIRRRQHNKLGMLNTQGKLILDYQYDYIRYDADSSGNYLPAPYVSISKNEKYGIADTTGKIIVPPIYDEWFGCSYNKLLFSSSKNEKDIILNLDGKPVLPDMSYDEMDDLQVGPEESKDAITLVKLKKNGLYGFYNPKTKKLIAPKYSDLDSDSYSGQPYLIEATYQKKHGYLDTDGNIVVPLDFDYVYHPQKKLVSVTSGMKKGVYDIEQKKLLIPAEYESIDEFPDSTLFNAVQKNFTGLIDFSGKIICPVKYDVIYALNGDNFLLEKKEPITSAITYDLFNRHTLQTTPLPYDNVRPAGEGLLLIVTTKGKQKLLDAATGKIIQGEYSEDNFPDSINTFDNHLSAIIKNNKTGYINAEGKIVVPIQYDHTTSFHNGVAMVIKEDDSNGTLLYGFINSTGKIIVPVTYPFDNEKDVYDYFQEGFLLLTKKNNGYLLGYAQHDGHILIAPEYSKIIPEKNGNGYLVERDRKFGILDSTGREILSPSFDDIMLEEQLSYSNIIMFAFPILAQKNGEWQYYTAAGKPLPLHIKGHIPFVQPEQSGGIPTAIQ
ncbi:WG containing repeat-containing protein [Chitinophaga sp. CF118]|uniref:WG repeat-containing protein n=1 Tax=Chitinophaga sp. CF118 TaxID=1884367 RepID=UPI0008EE520E|nr:WG repeat-containing protein [Chitinophaga sp. CF118]SFF02579.1 WG containing repeat-containing protein [Chitinophaga sp. CF118]